MVNAGDLNGMLEVVEQAVERDAAQPGDSFRLQLARLFSQPLWVACELLADFELLCLDGVEVVAVQEILVQKCFEKIDVNHTALPAQGA